jgi:Fe-S cluster assembly ATPase SufC
LCPRLHVERRRSVELARAHRAGLDPGVEATADQILQHLFVLILHQINEELPETLAVDDIGVGGLSRLDDVPAYEQMRDDVWILDARILGLDVIDVVFVAYVVVIARDHGVGTTSVEHCPWLTQIVTPEKGQEPTIDRD